MNQKDVFMQVNPPLRSLKSFAKAQVVENNVRKFQRNRFSHITLSYETEEREDIIRGLKKAKAVFLEFDNFITVFYNRPYEKNLIRFEEAREPLPKLI